MVYLFSLCLWFLMRGREDELFDYFFYINRDEDFKNIKKVKEQTHI